MGGLIFFLPVIIVTLLFNFTPYLSLPLIVFTAAALLGATDDIMNIFGNPRKIKSLDRIITLIKVHKNKLVQLKMIVLFPWYAFSRFMHIFESNPGSGLRAHEKIIIQAILGCLVGFWVYENFEQNRMF
jgi:UDP-N-acetylmuramyl pentapeptide phosphotransferase/UDP-N-acetylglucosamine-1-phosphate transferase